MHYVLFVLTAPFGVIIGWGWLALLFCVGAVKSFRWEPTLVLTAVFREWVIKPRVLPWSPKNESNTKRPIPLWRFSTTLGRAIAYQPNHRASINAPWTSVQHHEHVHIRQAEDRGFCMLAVGLITMLIVGPSTGDWSLAVGLFILFWLFGGFLQAVNLLTAAMRASDAYHDSEHERSAYAQTDPWGPAGESWLEMKARQKHTKIPYKK